MLNALIVKVTTHSLAVVTVPAARSEWSRQCSGWYRYVGARGMDDAPTGVCIINFMQPASWSRLEADFLPCALPTGPRRHSSCAISKLDLKITHPLFWYPYTAYSILSIDTAQFGHQCLENHVMCTQDEPAVDASRYPGSY